jgi:hypothetical protein
MLNKPILLVAILSISSWLFAQGPAKSPDAMVTGSQSTENQTANDASSTTACSFAYSSGSAPNTTAYCLSVNGNIVQFSRPIGSEYIENAEAIDEGYGICDVTGGTAYYDYASTDSANWGPTTVTFPNASSAKFVRSTNDGQWTLTQTIRKINANTSGPGSAKVTMAVKNRTGMTRSIYVIRHARVVVGGTPGATNVDQSQDAAFGNLNFFYGLSLTTNTFTGTVNHGALTWGTPLGPNPCDFNVNRILRPAVSIDGSIGLLHYGPVEAGQTMTVSMTYKPY